MLAIGFVEESQSMRIGYGLPVSMACRMESEWAVELNPALDMSGYSAPMRLACISAGRVW